MESEIKTRNEYSLSLEVDMRSQSVRSGREICGSARINPSVPPLAKAANKKMGRHVRETLALDLQGLVLAKDGYVQYIKLTTNNGPV